MSEEHQGSIALTTANDGLAVQSMHYAGTALPLYAKPRQTGCG